MEWYFMLMVVAGILIFFMLAGLPIAFSLGLTGFLGLLIFAGPIIAVRALNMVTYKGPQNFVLLAVPLFIFMAELLIFSGLGTVTYDGLSKLFSGLPGGLALASITMGVGFAAATGSSTASLGTIAPTAIKEMTDRRYAGWLAAGALGGAGGIAIIIPPSILLIVYGFIAEVSVAKLFMAGFFPGLLMGILYAFYTLILAKLRPDWAPADTSAPFKERIAGLLLLTPVLIIGFFIMAAIYLGVTTPTEAGAIGVLLAFITIALRRKLSWSALYNAMLETARVTGFCLIIVVGAILFGFLMSYLRIPFYITELTAKLGLSPFLLLFAIILLVLFLGTIMDTISIVLIIVPIVLPVLLVHELNPIWLGIILCMTLEIALTTPPVGMNLFVLAGIAKPFGISFVDVIKGSFPYIVCDMIAITFVILFPSLALWLPNTMRL
jgi:tripartite ATP-independent transporter DctM subunit